VLCTSKIFPVTYKQPWNIIKLRSSCYSEVVYVKLTVHNIFHDRQKATMFWKIWLKQWWSTIPLISINKQSSLTITINKQTIISHHYHQHTNNHLSPLPSKNKQSSLTITINKQTIISHHYHQHTNNHLSPLP
jgi:hypothetical protein